MYHIIPELILRLMDSRCVHKDNLSFVSSVHGLYAVSCCLWFLGRNRDLLPDQTVHQC